MIRPTILSVEPVILFYMLCFYMTSVGLQDLIYAKVCLSEYSITVCDDLHSKDNFAALQEVQGKSSYWMLLSNLTMFLPSIVVVQFIGSWSDIYGTNSPMLLPPLGGVISSFLYILLSVYLQELPLYFILLPSLMIGITGALSACILTCLNYVSKITNDNNRSMRISIIEAMILLSGCIGPLLTSSIQRDLGRSYVFVMTMGSFTFICIYIAAFLPNILPSNRPKEGSPPKLFQLQHLRESLSTVLIPRLENRRFYILLLFVVVAVLKLSTAVEDDLSYLYVKDQPIGWSLTTFSNYWALKHGVNTFSLLVILPFMRHYSDMHLLMLGLISFFIGFIIMGLAYNSAMVYSVSGATIFCTWCISMSRSALSKLVEVNEQGKLFACLASWEGIFLTIGTVVFNGMYPATRDVIHGFVFFVGGVILIIPFCIACFLQGRLKGLSSYSPECKEKDGIPSSPPTLIP